MSSYQCYCPEPNIDFCYICNPEDRPIYNNDTWTIYNTFKDIYKQNEQNVLELACSIFDDIKIKHRRKNRICCAFTCLFLAKYIIYKGIGSIEYIDSLHIKNIDKEYILDRKKLHFKIYSIRLNIESISKHMLLNTFDNFHINDVILNTMYLIKYDNFNIDDVDIHGLTQNYVNIHIDIGVAICILYLIEMNQKEYIKSIYTLNNKNRYKITIDCNFMSVYQLVNVTLGRNIDNYDLIDKKCINCKSHIVFKDTNLCLKHSIYNL
jgi:hypothetical protein